MRWGWLFNDDSTDKEFYARNIYHDRVQTRDNDNERFLAGYARRKGGNLRKINKLTRIFARATSRCSVASCRIASFSYSPRPRTES